MVDGDGLRPFCPRGMLGCALLSLLSPRIAAELATTQSVRSAAKTAGCQELQLCLLSGLHLPLTFYTCTRPIPTVVSSGGIYPLEKDEPADFCWEDRQGSACGSLAPLRDFLPLLCVWKVCCCRPLKFCRGSQQ
jgi:hypothetical protein